MDIATVSISIRYKSFYARLLRRSPLQDFVDRHLSNHEIETALIITLTKTQSVGLSFFFCRALDVDPKPGSESLEGPVAASLRNTHIYQSIDSKYDPVLVPAEARRGLFY
ncbi:hypothetical protein TWF128_009455 [Orbilia oligospora]|nr:hypothetical protein TWF128_009455 [Orbilia oligospora]